MIYLVGYLGIGVVILAVVLGAHWRTHKDEAAVVRVVLDAAHPECKSLSYRLQNHFALPVLAAVLAVLVWPVLVYMKIDDVWVNMRASVPQEFAVTRRHLRERLTVQRIEALEIVADPLGAVPDLPFGHLNAAWQTFIGGAAEQDDIWSFTAPRQTAWSRKEVRAGYVLVRGGVPGAHFLTMRKPIDDEAEYTRVSPAKGDGAARIASNEIPSWRRKDAD